MPVRINKGDTLSRMVAKYNRDHGTKLTVDQVAAANNIKNKNLIFAGRDLSFDSFEAAKPTDRKSTDTQSTDTQSTDTKSTDTKSTDTKSTDTKSTDTKSTDTKSTDTKSTDTKSTDAKSTDTKSTDAKSTDTKSTDAKSTVPDTTTAAVSNKPNKTSFWSKLKDLLVTAATAVGVQLLQKELGLEQTGVFDEKTHASTLEAFGQEMCNAIIGLFQRKLGETKTPAGKLDEGVKTSLIKSMTDRAATGATREARMTNALKVLQDNLALKGEVLPMNGEKALTLEALKKSSTYASLKRQYGAATADELIKVAFDLRGPNPNLTDGPSSTNVTSA